MEECIGLWIHRQELSKYVVHVEVWTERGVGNVVELLGHIRAWIYPHIPCHNATGL